jgi:uncharacterized protein
MIERPDYIKQIEKAVSRSRITSLLGARGCGKTTLSRIIGDNIRSVRFDMESAPDIQRLMNPELILGGIEDLIIIDEIQKQPSLFNSLRVIVDRPENKARFLILGSASPDIVKNVSETLAGRVEFVELGGFNLAEAGVNALEKLWLRGGMPRSFLAKTEDDSIRWREDFIRTYLERDIPQLGIKIPSAAMRRFWTMLAHYHGQLWDAAELARSMGLSGKTVRHYLDILSQTFMVRQLQPWYENIGKRQVKSPKIYFRDSGLLHSLLSITDMHDLTGNPRLGASWEGFAIEQFLAIIKPAQVYFWATHNGAELDLLFFHKGKRYGVEVKFSEAPVITKSMRIAIEDLKLEQLWIIYPGKITYQADVKITAMPLMEIESLKI